MEPESFWVKNSSFVWTQMFLVQNVVLIIFGWFSFNLKDFWTNLDLTITTEAIQSAWGLTQLKFAWLFFTPLPFIRLISHTKLLFYITTQILSQYLKWVVSVPILHIKQIKMKSSLISIYFSNTSYKNWSKMFVPIQSKGQRVLSSICNIWIRKY